MIDAAIDAGRKSGIVNLGDLVVITAGIPVGRSGSTNMIKVHHVGELIARGQGIGSQTATGKIVVARTAKEALEKMTEGAILVAPGTDKEFMPAFQKAAGVITTTGGITSHAAVVGLNLGKPVIIGVENAMDLLEDGKEVSLYAEQGFIYSGKAKVL
jgi:pyruvate kinase